MKNSSSTLAPRISQALLATLLLAAQASYAQAAAQPTPAPDASPAPAGEASPTAPQESAPASPAAEKSVETAKSAILEESQVKAAASTSSSKVERIEVTGSRIKRIDIESAIPTKVLRKEDFDKAGVTSITELLQQQTENTFGSFNGGGGYVSVGQTTLSLHGLGAGRTLVLVNGRRLPVEASLGGTNINNIPLAMVDRVEILKMSASAVYGADAVAGVINVILKKSVQGSEVATSANISHEKGGGSVKASAVTGFNVWDTDITLAIGGGHTDRILSRDRDKLWAAAYPYNQSTGGAPGGTYSWGLLNTGRPSSNLGNFIYHPSANCPQENQIALPNDPTNTLCRGKARDVSVGELMPNKEERFVTLNFEHSFGSVNTSTTLLGSTVHTSSFPSSRTLTANPARTGAYSIPYGQTPAELKTQAKALDLYYTDGQLIKFAAPLLFPEVKGNIETVDTSLGVITSLSGAISKSWGWHFDASHFASKRTRTYQKAPDRLEFTRNLYPVANTGVPVLNIFTDDTSVINNWFVDLHTEEANLTTGGTAYAEGPVFSLPGGEANLAAGVSANHEKYILRADHKDSQFLSDFPETAGILKARYLGSFASDGFGKRDVTSGFLELDLPVLKEVDLGLTGRYDHYSDFGNSFNYGSSLVVSPLSGLKVRGNVGSGFRAPTLAEIHNRNNGGYLGVTDSKYCDNTIPADNPCGSNGKGYNVYVNRPGNRDLKEEISLSYNLGVIVEPSNFYSVSVDYWSAKIDDIIGQEELDKLVEKDIKGESLGSSKVNRGQEGRIGSIENSYSNLGKMRSKGYDIASQLDLGKGDLKYGLNTNYSRVLSRKEKPTIEDPTREYVGAYGVPRYRMTNSLFVRTAEHSASFDVTTIAKQESGKFDNEPAYGYISPENRYDISYGWNYAKSGTLNLGIYNIENRITSLYLADRDTRDVTYNRSSNDVRGRQYQIGVRQAF